MVIMKNTIFNRTIDEATGTVIILKKLVDGRDLLFLTHLWDVFSVSGTVLCRVPNYWIFLSQCYLKV